MSDEVTEESKALAREHGITVQPDPTSNDRPSSHDLVIEDLDIVYGSTVNVAAHKVKIDLMKRKQFGLAKYGTLLQSHNGRDSIADAYDEVLDAIVYLRTAQAECGGFVPNWLNVCYRLSIDVAYSLAGELMNRDS